MNNYEKIKSMSVDEMAEWISKTDCSNTCVYHTEYDRIYENLEGCTGMICTDGIKQWLLAEVEE